MHATAFSSAPVNDADLDARSVLVVDDDPDILAALAELLEDEGYDVTTVTDGQAALSHLRAGRRPRVILLDLMMPGMNGWDFRAEQMKDVDLRDIPVVVITAAVVTESALRAQLGDVSLMRKPPQHDELIGLLRRHCDDTVH